MVTIQQLQRGFARFVDTHISVAYNGIEKAFVLGGATLLANGFPKMIENYTSTPVMAALDIYHKENGLVDIDALYNAFVPHMGAEKFPVALPKIGNINLGTIKLGKEDIDLFMRYVKEA